MEKNESLPRAEVPVLNSAVDHTVILEIALTSAHTEKLFSGPKAKTLAYIVH